MQLSGLLEEQSKANKALKFGAIDSVVESSKLRDSALKLFELASNGSLDWQAREKKRKTHCSLYLLWKL